MDFTSNTKFMLLQLGLRKFCSISYSNFATNRQHKQLDYTCIWYDTAICTYLANFASNFVHLIRHQFCTFYQSPKVCTWLAEQFRTFHPSQHESVTPYLNISIYEYLNMCIPLDHRRQGNLKKITLFLLLLGFF